MRNLLTIIPLLILALILNAETVREKLIGDIDSAYTEMGFYSAFMGTGKKYMVYVTTTKEEPYNIHIWFKENMPKRRYLEAIQVGVVAVGKVTGKIKEKTFMVWFSIWDSDHKTFVPLATILTSNCRKFLTLKKAEERKAFLKECLIFNVQFLMNKER